MIAVVNNTPNILEKNPICVTMLSSFGFFVAIIATGTTLISNNVANCIVVLTKTSPFIEKLLFIMVDC